MKFRHTLFIATLLIAGTISWPVKSRAAQFTDTPGSGVETVTGAAFTERERQLVEEYFGKMPVSTKTAATPEPDGDDVGGTDTPAETNLAQNDPLPPGLVQRDLPADLLEQMPPPPAGFERQIVGDSAVVLIDQATGRVADIIKDVLIPGADD